jgi:hypothetical protein
MFGGVRTSKHYVTSSSWHRVCGRLCIREYSVRISASTPAITTKGVLWFSSLHPGKCRDSISNWPLQFPSIYFTIHQSAYISTQYSLWTTISIPGKAKNFVFSTPSLPVLGPTQITIQRVPGPIFSGIKRLRREADHSPPTNAEVKNMWIYTSTPHPLPRTPS